MCIPVSCLNHYASSVTVISIITIVTADYYCFTWNFVMYPCAGPAAPPAPAIRSPARALTLIALKPMPAVKQASELEAVMWWHTAARLRNSQQLEKVSGYCSIGMD
jgi:hypothetical protein